MRKPRRAATLSIACAVLAPLALTACSDGTADPVEIADGVTYYAEEHTTKLVHVMEVDLSKASLDVLYPGKIGEVARPQDLAENAGAVGVINGDFFNNDVDENEAGHTNASVGPMISGGEHLTAAVPEGQRTGPPRPPGSTNRSVLGVTDSEVLTTTLDLKASATLSSGVVDIAALNQYAIPENEIGLFTSDWGLSRERAVCGKDDKRHAACSDSVREVIVKDNIITAISDTAGEKPLESGEVALLARDDAVKAFRGLLEGDTVTTEYELVPENAADLTAALGGVPLLDKNGAPRKGLEDDKVEPRTAVGWKDGGSTLVMAVVDGAGDSGGATQLSLAMYAAELELEGAMNLDGGGSSLMATRENDAMEVRNSPSAERGGREVANALAVFADQPGDKKDDDMSDLVGRWEFQGTDSPTNISALGIEEDGSVWYWQEGSPAEYTGELEAPDGKGEYSVVLRATGEDADLLNVQEFTLRFKLSDNGEELIVNNEDGESVYKRVD